MCRSLKTQEHDVMSYSGDSVLGRQLEAAGSWKWTDHGDASNTLVPQDIAAVMRCCLSEGSTLNTLLLTV